KLDPDEGRRLHYGQVLLRRERGYLRSLAALRANVRTQFAVTRRRIPGRHAAPRPSRRPLAGTAHTRTPTPEQAHPATGAHRATVPARGCTVLQTIAARCDRSR